MPVWQVVDRTGAREGILRSTIYLGTIAPGEDVADPDVRRVDAELVSRAVALSSASSSPVMLK